MITRGHFLEATLAAGALLTLDQIAGGEPVPVAAEFPIPLTPFKDPLRLPPVLRPQQLPDGTASVTIRLRAATQKLHSELPPTPTPFWGYEGLLPGPTIEVQRGQKLRVEYINELPTASDYPVTAVVTPTGAQQNRPGREGQQPDPTIATLKPWTVTHLHGGRTAAGSDGWTENAVFSGQSTLCSYDNDQPATTLWYHDHAFGITRYNVYAGLAGLYIIRDPEEAALNLPAGKYEIPLLIQDRNFDAAPDGALTGRLLHKTTDDTMEFFGPFTTVNATLWPYLDVEPRQYRFRVINASNSRTYRLVLLDENGANLLHLLTQIGTDGGLLDVPVSLPPDGLTLAPAERADLIVDFRALHGRRLTLVNTAQAPFKGLPATKDPGAPDPEHRIPYPQVMQFRVSPTPVDDLFVMPTRLSTFRRFTAADLATISIERTIALIKHEVNGHDMFMLHELVPADAPMAGEPLITIQDHAGVTMTYRTVATRFEDTVNFMIAEGSTEIWHFLNLTKNMHPMHLHLVQFQAIRRDLYNDSGFDSNTFATKTPLRFKKSLALGPNELGPKDTIRVNPGERVSIAMIFQGYTGRYMYHCHMLEHEDMDMMRPFLVVPAAAMTAMGMGPMKTGSRTSMSNMKI